MSTILGPGIAVFFSHLLGIVRCCALVPILSCYLYNVLCAVPTAEVCIGIFQLIK